MSMPNVGSVIFCEQIRFETSGQFSVIGVWPPLIEVEEFPFSEALGVLLVWKDMPKEILLELTLRSGSGAEFGKANFRTGVPVEPNGLNSYLPFPPRQVTLSAPDTIEVLVGIDGNEPQVVGLMRIVLDESSPSQESVND